MTTKMIYTKWIKEKLENEYNLFPIKAIPNPKNIQLKIWVYNMTSELSFALDCIMEDKQDGSARK